MNLISRPKNMGDIRSVAVKAATTDSSEQPELVEVPTLSKTFGPSANNPFRSGDIVIYRFNQKGTVISAEGDGVQVDFGLGVHSLSYLVLRLSQN